MLDLRFFDELKRHRRLEDAPLADLQLWSKIITRSCENLYQTHGIWGFVFRLCSSKPK